MSFDFLPERIKNALKNYSFENLTEIRLRIGFPIKIKYKNTSYNLLNDFNNIICTKNDISEIISNVTERSIYAFNDNLKRGFLTTGDGFRIGIVGECVFENEKIKTIKNITSLNVRIAHNVKDCSKDIYDKLFDNKIFNTIIISPPAKGKTTLLKDLALKLNDSNKYSILVIDERGEFSNISGENIDLIKFCDKTYAFNIAIRSMAPDVIIVDELINIEDWKCALNAVNSGVKLIASVHSENINDLVNKNEFISGVFERYVVIKSEGPPGQISKIYNKDLLELWKFFYVYY